MVLDDERERKREREGKGVARLGGRGLYSGNEKNLIIGS